LLGIVSCDIQAEVSIPSIGRGEAELQSG